MSRTVKEVAEEQRQKLLKRQWIENYKKYRRLAKEAEAELDAE